MFNNGRRVAYYLIPPCDSPETVRPPEGGKIVLENRFHGDNDEDWLVSYDSAGGEVHRWNVHWVMFIQWLEVEA